MMRTFRNPADFVLSNSPTELPLDVIWIDLLNPTQEEDHAVERRAAKEIVVEADEVAGENLRLDYTISSLQHELKQKKLIVSSDGEHYEKADKLGRPSHAQVLADVRT
jgi:uncharacterized protein YjhX (UPF0386 family)